MLMFCMCSENGSSMQGGRWCVPLDITSMNASERREHAHIAVVVYKFASLCFNLSILQEHLLTFLCNQFLSTLVNLIFLASPRSRYTPGRYPKKSFCVNRTNIWPIETSIFRVSSWSKQAQSWILNGQKMGPTFMNGIEEKEMSPLLVKSIQKWQIKACAQPNRYCWICNVDRSPLGSHDLDQHPIWSHNETGGNCHIFWVKKNIWIELQVDWGQYSTVLRIELVVDNEYIFSCRLQKGITIAMRSVISLKDWCPTVRQRDE